MKKVLFLGLAIFFQSFLFAQDSLPPHLEGKIIYPAIDLHPFMGVVKMGNTVLKYNPSIDYKVALTGWEKWVAETQAKPLIKQRMKNEKAKASKK